MREKKLYRIFTFRSTTQAMAFEKQCGLLGIPGRMIPTPREISASCGLSWRMDIADYPMFQEMIGKLGMEFEQEAELLL